jgi:hypothetical protein
MMAAMRFRIWHLLALIALVALWVPLSQWLLALEAQDHPRKPQEAIDVICFYLGTAPIVCLLAVIAGIVVRKRGTLFSSDGSTAPRQI